MLPFEISPGEAELARRADPNIVLLDCREADELNAARVQGALHIPMGEVPSRANQELDPDADIFVICHLGMRSLSVAVWLRRQGFEKARSIAGGIDRWSKDVDPAVPRY